MTTDRAKSRFIGVAVFGRFCLIARVPAFQETDMLDITKRPQTTPFDTARLDRLMDETGIDVLVATSKHNVQYLMGGHRAFFFESMDAMGLSRYLPVFVYAKGEV